MSKKDPSEVLELVRFGCPRESALVLYSNFGKAAAQTFPWVASCLAGLKLKHPDAAAETCCLMLLTILAGLRQRNPYGFIQGQEKDVAEAFGLPPAGSYPVSIAIAHECAKAICAFPGSADHVNSNPA